MLRAPKPIEGALLGLRVLMVFVALLFSDYTHISFARVFFYTSEQSCCFFARHSGGRKLYTGDDDG